MAVEWKWIDRLPCRPKKLEEGEGRIIALSDDQCNSLLRAAVKSADPDCWLFVAFGLNTAMRHSEMLASRFDRIDFASLGLFVPDAKAGQREQPITPEPAKLLLKERETRDDRIAGCFRRRMRGANRAIGRAWTKRSAMPSRRPVSTLSW
ncbi:MAG TPA: hypothetical protein VKQ29_15710 [Aliidongia sp.]|nr:hypothetical protein [Aliidongia sp.]